MNIKQLTKIISPYLSKGCFKLPEASDPSKQVVHIVGVSGGVDSSATALCLKVLFPNANFLYVHTSTGFSSDGTDESINKLEAFLGQEILRPSAKYSLLEAIKKAGGYLPAPNARTCTSAQKIIPMQNFVTLLKTALGGNVEIKNYVGLRFDEPDREGATFSKKSSTTSHFPLRDLKLTKREVNQIVESTIGIPVFYLGHSRSSCVICPFHRTAEVIESWARSPRKVEAAAEFEILPDNIKDAYNDLPTPVSEETGISRNWMGYPRPDWLGYPKLGCQDEQGKTKSRKKDDLFGGKSIFVAVEFQYHGGIVGMALPQVFREQIITFSTSKSGLQRALTSFWAHRIDTRELHGFDDTEKLEAEKQIAMIEVSIDNFDELIPAKPEGTFTWLSSKRPLLQIRKLMAVLEHILLKEGLRQEGKTKKLEMVTRDLGRVVSFTKFEHPKAQELLDELEDSDEPQACEVCSR